MSRCQPRSTLFPYTTLFRSQLGTLAGVSALEGGSHLEGVGEPGDHVLLVEEVDDPERVDDVAGLQADLDVLVDRQVEHGQGFLSSLLAGGEGLDTGRLRSEERRV